MKLHRTQASSKFPTPHYIITNLEYRLKPLHKRNQYLRARLDTCAYVNIMPASVYKFVFQDPHCKKLAPSSKLKIGTYTTNKVTVVGSCVLYFVHPDTKCLQEVTFYVASNNGSVVLSCVTTHALGLIQSHTRLDYPPPRASLITSNVDHPMKTISQMNVHVSKADSMVCMESNEQGMRPKLMMSKDHNIHISKQEALMSSQQGIVPKLNTSGGSKLSKLHVHQITNQSSTRSELCLKYSYSKCKQKPSTSLGRKYQCILGPGLPLTFSILKVHLIC